MSKSWSEMWNELHNKGTSSLDLSDLLYIKDEHSPEYSFPPCPLPIYSILGAHVGEIKSLSVSCDSKLFASAGRDSIIRVYDLDTLYISHELKGHAGSVKTLSFSPTNPSLLISTAYDDTLRLWDVDSESCLLNAHHLNITSAIFSQNSSLIISAGKDNRIKIWEPGNPTSIKILDFRNQKKNFPGTINSLTLSADNRYLFTAGDSTLSVWDLKLGKLIRIFSQEKHTKRHYKAVSFGADGLLNAIFKSCESSGLYLSQISTEDWSENLKILEDFGQTLSQSRLSTRMDINGVPVKCEDKNFKFPVKSQLRNAFVTPDNKMLMVAEDGGFLHCWNLETGCYIQCLEGYFLSTSFSFFEKLERHYIISGDENGNINFWNSPVTYKKNISHLWSDFPLHKWLNKIISNSFLSHSKTQVEHLVLRGVRIYEADFKILCKLLTSYPMLKSCDLKKTSLSYKQRSMLVTILASNKVCKKIAVNMKVDDLAAPYQIKWLEYTRSLKKEDPEKGLYSKSLLCKTYFEPKSTEDRSKFFLSNTSIFSSSKNRATEKLNNNFNIKNVSDLSMLEKTDYSLAEKNYLSKMGFLNSTSIKDINNSTITDTNKQKVISISEKNYLSKKGFSNENNNLDNNERLPPLPRRDYDDDVPPPLPPRDYEDNRQLNSSGTKHVKNPPQIPPRGEQIPYKQEVESSSSCRVS